MARDPRSWVGDNGKGWTDWLFDSERSVQVGRAVCVLAAVGAGIAAAILLTNLARSHKVAGVTELLWVAIPALVVGQLWCCAVLAGVRHPDRLRPLMDGGFDGLWTPRIGWSGSAYAWLPVPACESRRVHMREPLDLHRSRGCGTTPCVWRFLGFLVMQFGIALAELRRRRAMATGTAGSLEA